MRYTGSSTYSPFNLGFISMFLSFHLQIFIEQDRIQPKVAVIIRRRIFMQCNTRNIFQ